MEARREDGQVLLLALGGAFALIAGALALVAIAGAVTGKGRAQRGADLAAISAARSMRDDLPRLLAAAVLPDGLPNPAHVEKLEYLARARAAASDVARANDIGPARLKVTFPDIGSFAPVRVKAVVTGSLALGGGGSKGGSADVEAAAVAEAAAPAGSATGSMPTMASGGGYGGPLVYRTGEGMRPDVAVAFDRMAAAASHAGLTLVVNSGFRSDAEQAVLFAAHPDPTWVAPPGHSLHRCATELDLGPESAYGWLAANASRFSFVQRYSWESADFAEGATTGRTGTRGPASSLRSSAIARSLGLPGLERMKSSERKTRSRTAPPSCGKNSIESMTARSCSLTSTTVRESSVRPRRWAFRST
ncbi:MAG TPA: D-alanyl-D-alanine carboxypeptidase family protein [Solirubrobacterales bacterium]